VTTKGTYASLLSKRVIQAGGGEKWNWGKSIDNTLKEEGKRGITTTELILPTSQGGKNKTSRTAESIVWIKNCTFRGEGIEGCRQRC